MALSTECGPREEVLAAAAHTAGIDSAGATLIRDGSNVLYRLAGNTVTRIGPSGSREVAEREIGVSRWLANVGVPGVHALPDLPQPTMVGDCPVTWWQYLAKSRDGTTAELAALLRALHDAPAPEALGLPYHDPFAGIVGRIDAATHVGEEDRDWLRQQLDRLQEMYRQRHRAGGGGVIHGDAGQGNVVVTTAGQAVLIDFEHVSYGDSEWDLIPVGVDYVDFVRLDADDYRAFVDAYCGYDVTTAPGFRLLADIQELRWVCFAFGKAEESAPAMRETRHRIACLRGEVARPWTWTAF